MTQTTILASGTTEASSSDIVVPSGAIVTVGIFATNPGASLAGRGFAVLQLTPGAPNRLDTLDETQRSVQLNGPGTFRVDRPELQSEFGVCLDA